MEDTEVENNLNIDNINDSIKTLEQAMYKISPTMKPVTKTSKMNKYLVYSSILFFFLILLLYLKPNFILYDSVDKETNEIRKKVSISKLVIWDIIVSIPIFVGLYLYNNKKIN